MRLLFVCTGNTCRSPLAEAAWQAISDELKPALEKSGLGEIMVASAGLAASKGCVAAAHSVTVARTWGVDLSTHRSQPLTVRLVAEADLILTMTQEQAAMLRLQYPGSENKVRGLGSYCGEAEAARLESLWPGSTTGNWPGPDIEDPFGGSLEEYHECARQIEECVRQLARQLIDSRH